ncbi:MAG TPA: glycosyltransferase family 39 protein [Bryobacteraceae bacterium]|nr:glycosyltransferase family 39 protein [Bryobacteraceae bacterium]
MDRRSSRIVLLFVSIIFVTSLISPPGLMNDVDGAQGQIGRGILQTGDWVTMHINGVKYMEKPPLKYWLIAISFKIFGIHDWAARIPVSLSAILLCWLVVRMTAWALGERAGLYAGLSLGTCVGLWLFTRILIPDVMLTALVTLALWGFLRSLDTGEVHWRRWSLTSWAAAGLGILAKGLIAVVFPIGTAVVYLLFTGLWRERQTWRRLSVLPGVAILLAVAAPWHILATLQNPPYFDFTMHAESGSYRGFFWMYFFNEHILRFLNRRYPHDYNTVPPWLFWLLHFAWFFPWSAFLIRTFGLKYRSPDRAARMRLLALCWIGVVLGFFSLSTTQEYYSMPAYPAIAILIGSAMTEASDRTFRISMRTVAVVAGVALAAICGLLWASHGYAAPGDISKALATNSSDYTLSLDHMGDLTIRSFAYLRLPLAIAGLAMLIGALGGWILPGRSAAIALAVMMTLFFQAARLALIAFDPYLGSRTLGLALKQAPPGGLMIDDAYYEMSSLFFYSGRQGLMLNGRFNNLEYGSYSPGAPDVFIDDAGFVRRWKSSDRWYVASEDDKVKHLRDLVGVDSLRPIASAGGKTIYVNR